MSEPIDERAVYDLLAEVNARLDAAIAKNVQRRDARAKERAEMLRRRTWAKARINALRLARARYRNAQEKP